MLKNRKFEPHFHRLNDDDDNDAGYMPSIKSTISKSQIRALGSQAKLIVSISAAILNLIVIMILNKIYLRLALKLTRFENQKTDKDYEDSFTLKMFCFQFVNFYASIFYIAFFKGRFHEFFRESKELQV